MRREIILSSIILAAVIAIYASLSLFEEPGAAIFPRVIIITMAILSGILLMRSIILGKAGITATMEFRVRPFLTCFVLIIIYIFFLERIGFYVSSFLFFLAVTFILGAIRVDLRKTVYRVTSSAVFMGVLYLLFNTLLKVQTPKGILF
jgi:putative tricarboxylic transport membrane protein